MRGKKTRLRVSRQRGRGWCCQHVLTWVPVWSQFGAQRWGEHVRAPCGGGQRGRVPTRGEMLASPGDTPCLDLLTGLEGLQSPVLFLGGLWRVIR